MKERPILFSGPMVRALLDGSKTQTRRVVKMKPHHQIEERDNGTPWPWMYDGERDADSWMACPYGQPGDRLWVRETWRIGSWDDGCGFWIDYRDGPRKERLECPDVDLAYRLIEQTGEDLRKCNIQPTNGTMYEWTPGQSPLRWRPSIHMPRWASRITLEITSVRVELLQDISEVDAMAEGVTALSCANMWTAGGMYDGPLHDAKPCGAYRRLWNSINGADSWEANPWVWAIEFKRFQK